MVILNRNILLKYIHISITKLNFKLVKAPKYVFEVKYPFKFQIAINKRFETTVTNYLLLIKKKDVQI